MFTHQIFQAFQFTNRKKLQRHMQAGRCDKYGVRWSLKRRKNIFSNFTSIETASSIKQILKGILDKVLSF